MATDDETAVDSAEDKCANCGACKSCGAGGRPQYVPMPYPVYPYPYAQPYRTPYQWPYAQPYLGGLSPNINGTSRQPTNRSAGNVTWNSGAGNYNG